MKIKKWSVRIWKKENEAYIDLRGFPFIQRLKAAWVIITGDVLWIRNK